ncbi:hypothetical protein C5167_012074, partial [Papaver somniferum]
MLLSCINSRRIADDVGCAPPVSAHPSRPPRRTAFDYCVDTLGSAEARLAHLHHELLSACMWLFAAVWCCEAIL